MAIELDKVGIIHNLDRHSVEWYGYQALSELVQERIKGEKLDMVSIKKNLLSFCMKGNKNRTLAREDWSQELYTFFFFKDRRYNSVFVCRWECFKSIWKPDGIWGKGRVSETKDLDKQDIIDQIGV